VSQALDRVRQAARHRRKERFTALLHHISLETLEVAFHALKRRAAPGVDGVTWQEYEADLGRRLVDLHGRIHRGAYRPQPSRRVYIPKAGGRRRPLAIAALEDKLVQGATVMVLSAIYEEDFLGFSYGFRPGRGPHDALDALAVGITSRKVNFILDADIRSFFDTVSQDWLVRFVEHRIGDPRIIRLIRKWLKAGVLEDGTVTVSDRGTGQGSVVSPLLANIYLHYVFDLWAERWRRHEATGDMIIVRYADDLVVGFQHEVLSALAPNLTTRGAGRVPLTPLQEWRARWSHDGGEAGDGGWRGHTGCGGCGGGGSGGVRHSLDRSAPLKRSS
jgi:group II intron reverse transcriptase/maturase